MLPTAITTADMLGKPPENSPKTLPFNFLLAIAKRRGFHERHVGTFASQTRDRHEKSEAVLARLTNEPRGWMFALVGQRGTGKTQIATDVAMPRLMASPDEKTMPRYTTAADIFREIRAGYRRDSGLDERAIFRTFIRPSLLVIDEAQVRAETEFENRVLTEIVDQRYGAVVDTLLISNLTPKELAASLGTSIVSRIHECGECIVCDWPSFRAKVSA